MHIFAFYLYQNVLTNVFNYLSLDGIESFVTNCLEKEVMCTTVFFKGWIYKFLQAIYIYIFFLSKVINYTCTVQYKINSVPAFKFSNL